MRPARTTRLQSKEGQLPGAQERKASTIFSSGEKLRSGFRVLLNLQLFRELQFALCVLRAAQFPVSLSKQVVRNRVVRVHGQGALQSAHCEGGLTFFLQDLPHENVGPR